jgi:ribosomal protein L31
MNVSAPEFIASTDMYTPTIIGTKIGDTTHLAIDSDVIIDNQQADIPTTLQIKSDRDSGLTLQDDITNQSIVTYGGNLILAPDAGHLEVIPAVNDTNFGTAEYPWGNITGTYFIGDGSLLTNLPSSGGDFNDTGLLYQNGTRGLTGNWDVGQYTITNASSLGVKNTGSLGNAKFQIDVTGGTHPFHNSGSYKIVLNDGHTFSINYDGTAAIGTTDGSIGIYPASTNTYIYHLLPQTDNTYDLGATGGPNYWRHIRMKGNLVFGTANTTDIGTSSSYANEVFAHQYYGKNDTILAFDEYDDIELIRNIRPMAIDSNYFEMPDVLYDNITEMYNKTIIDKGIEKNITEEITTKSLNIGKVIGLSYGGLQKIILWNDDQQSELAYLTLENQRLKEQIINICKENDLKGCT